MFHLLIHKTAKFAITFLFIKAPQQYLITSFLEVLAHFVLALMSGSFLLLLLSVWFQA